MTARRNAVKVNVIAKASGLAIVFALASTALADDAPTADDDAAVRVCEAYGPGYQVVPGTKTCIKVTGSVEVDANTSGSGQTSK
jgi:hypothetical protein